MTITMKYNYFCNRRQEEGLERSLVKKTELVSFASNDYLGLSQDPRVKKAAASIALEKGVGTGSSRLVDGNCALHHELEECLAWAKGTQTALLFASGYQANLTALPALLDARVLGYKPLVFTDKLNHASLHAGCQLAGVRQIRFRHNDMNHLAYCLKQYQTSTQPKFIITESLFSMDGDIAPLKDLIDLCDLNQASLYLDEAHAMGMYGDNGFGFASYFKGQVPFVMGTLSKAVGAFGGYIACSHEIKRYLLNRCGGVIYTTSLPLPIVGAAIEAMRLIPEMTQERQMILTAASKFSKNASSHIVPVFCESVEEALKQQKEWGKKGVYVPAIRPPTVPTPRLRFSFTALNRSVAF